MNIAIRWRPLSKLKHVSVQVSEMSTWEEGGASCRVTQPFSGTPPYCNILFSWLYSLYWPLLDELEFCNSNFVTFCPSIGTSKTFWKTLWRVLHNNWLKVDQYCGRVTKKIRNLSIKCSESQLWFNIIFFFLC